MSFQQPRLRRRECYACNLLLCVTACVLIAAPLLHAQPAAVPEPDSATRRHLVARRTTEPIRVDGQLSELAWQMAPIARDFSQVRQDYRPHTAFPTEVRILFDDRNLYVGAFNRDSAGLSTLRMQDLRRDFESGESDVFGITVGSLGDGRTAFQFQVSPLGSLSDVQAFDGGDVSNFNWDALWRARTTRTDSGWVAEMAIPWRSLRYGASLKSWDLNLVRNTRRALQWSAWSPYPRQFSSWRLSYAGVLDSLAPPPPRANVRIRPYSLLQVARDRSAAGFNGSTGDVGGELIWAPTASSLLEATVNTDFAQAEVDRQVVNLTRFNVFFPEQRGFFLENADLLSAGGLSGRYVLQPFFSRRIGLDDNGTPVPIAAGARYGYRTGRSSAGALVMHQRGNSTASAATFGVLRGSRFFGRATRLAATVALREDAAQPGSAGVPTVATNASGTTNVVTSLDALTRIGEQVQLQATVSTSTDAGRTGVGVTYFAGRTTPFMYTGILGAIVDRSYAPRTGFVSRSNVLLTSPAASINWQPSWRPKAVVWFKPGITTYFYQDPKTFRLQEGIVTAYTEVLLRDGGTWRPYVDHNLQRPEVPVPLLDGVSIAAGTHDYTRYGVDAKSDQSARVAVTANVSGGGLFDGTLTRALLSARWSPSPYLAFRGNYEVNRIRNIGTRDTSLTTHLVGPELRAFLNPRLQTSAFYQYNTANQRGTLNARFSWEFAPLSYVYVVYNDRQAILDGVVPAARSLIVKLSWLRQL